MDRPRRRLWPERLAVALILASLGGAVLAVIVVHGRRRPETGPAPIPAPVVVATVDPKPEPKPGPAPAADPTAPILAELGAAEAEQRAEADAARKKIGAIEAASLAAGAEAARWKRSVAMADGQVRRQRAEADRVESKAEADAAARDALARRRDALKKALEADKARPGYAILPRRGLNGTWQRPIVLECADGSVSLRPDGPTFNLNDLASSFGAGGLRGSAFVAAITRVALRIQRQTAPDGGEVTPYIFFLVRPDGIRPYYEARTRLERLGVAFGYELVDADWQIDVPDLDHPGTWDGSPPPLRLDAPPADGSGRGGNGDGTAQGGGGGIEKNPFIWPRTAGGIVEGESGGGSSSHGGPGRRGDDPLDIGSAGPTGRAGIGVDRDGMTGRSQAGAGSEVGGGVRGAGLADAGRANPLDQATPGGAPPPYPPPQGGRRTSEPSPLAGEGRVGGSGGGSQRSRATASGGAGPGQGEGSTDRPGGQGRQPGSIAQSEGMAPRAGGSAWNRALQLDDPDRPVGLSPLGAGVADGADAPGGGQATGSGRMSATAEHLRALAQQLAAEGASGEPGGRPPTGVGGRGNLAGDPPSGVGSPGATGSTGGSDAASGGIPSIYGGGQPGFAGSSPPQRPLRLVLACGPKGVAIHPGDYRVTIGSLRAKDSLLPDQVRAVVRHAEEATPNLDVRPSIRFLVEPGGRSTYALARAQLGLSGVDWPSSMQVSGGDVLRLFSSDDW